MDDSDTGDLKTDRLISIVVPVLNEQDSISGFVTAIKSVFSGLDEAYEIIFVNDGSSDATQVAITTLMKSDNTLKLVSFTRNFGKESALRAGFEFASGDAVIPMDVDLQDPPAIIPEMIEKWRTGAKVVNARRVDRSKDSWAKRATAKAFYKTFALMSDTPMPGNVADFRLMDREVVAVICGLEERVRFNRSLIAWAGFDADEVTFERPERQSGRTTFTYWKLWNYALDGMLTSSTVPLRIWSYIGVLMSGVSFIYATYIFFYTVIFGADTPGYASTVILILLFGGLNLLAIGIIGEYIGRIYTEVRARPLYVVRSALGFDKDK